MQNINPSQTQTGKLSFPPKRERPGGFFKNGMAVQVLGPDPDDPNRVIVSLGEEKKTLSFDQKFIVVD